MKTRLVVSCMLVLLGLAPVLYFAALLAWQIGGLFTAGKWFALPATLLVAEFGWTAPAAVAWVLDRVHLGLIPAVPGAALAAFGALGALRHFAVLRAEKQRREDRLRRLRDYRRDELGTAAPDGRREPYIGPA